MRIIPTKFKEKIPKGFSYPIGAKILSESFGDVPQFDFFTISFWHKDGYWASSYRAKIKEKSSIKIIEVSYEHLRPHFSSSQFMIESGYYEPKWHIRVNAVPSEYAALIKEQLSANVLPELSLLLKKAVEETMLAHMIWVVLFNPKINEVSLSV